MRQPELIVKKEDYYIRIFFFFQAVLTMTYSPLVVGETEDYLEVSNDLVGTFVYKIILKCLPAKEKNLEYTASLGTNMPIRLRVHNKTDSRAEFECTVIILYTQITLSWQRPTKKRQN